MSGDDLDPSCPDDLDPTVSTSLPLTLVTGGMVQVQLWQVEPVSTFVPVALCTTRLGHRSPVPVLSYSDRGGGGTWMSLQVQVNMTRSIWIFLVYVESIIGGREQILYFGPESECSMYNCCGVNTQM